MSQSATFMLALAWIAIAVSTALGYWGCAYYMRDAAVGKWKMAMLWLIIQLPTIPLTSWASLVLYRDNPSWWSVEFPYWATGLLASYISMRGILGIAIGWREIGAGVILLLAAHLMARK